jgi:hypothetical protein
VLGLCAADLDGDDVDEIILTKASEGTLVYSGGGDLLWSVPASLYLGDVVVAQCDSDPALEIVTSAGQVIDTAAKATQWDVQLPGTMVEAADIDGDGRAEAFLARIGYPGKIWVLDVDEEAVVSEFEEWDVNAICVADLEADGVAELLVGHKQVGDISIHDVSSFAELGVIDHSDHVVAVEVSDVDRDGFQEIVWTTDGEVVVADALSLEADWRSANLRGRFLGPVIGDVSGDGIPDIVAASERSVPPGGASFSTPANGAVLVFSQSDFSLSASAQPDFGSGASNQVYALELHDLDQDGIKEIVVGGMHPYRGELAVLKDAGDGGLTQVWTNASKPDGAAFYSVDVADVDGDGDLEVLGGTGGLHTGSLGNFVYAYDGTTGMEEWRTPVGLGGTFDEISEIQVRDVDGDGVLEVVAMVEKGDVAIYDGMTHDLEGMIEGSHTALQLVAGLIVVADVEGMVRAYHHDGGQVTMVAAQQILPGAVDGFGLLGPQMLCVGGDERLQLFDPLSFALEVSSDPYGRFFGERAILVHNWGGPLVVTAGTYCILGLRWP